MDNLNPQQIQQMIELLQNMLPSEEQEASEVVQEEFESPIKTKSSRRPIQGKRQNLFDQMMESKLHKEDVEIDKKLSATAGPTPRNRSSGLVDVHCRVCGKKEQVNATIITDRDRYKCNKCAVGAG